MSAASEIRPVLQEAKASSRPAPRSRGRARGEVLDVLALLPRTGAVRADLRRRPPGERWGCRRPGTSSGASARAAPFSALDQRRHNLGNDVAGTLTTHPVADADVLRVMSSSLCNVARLTVTPLTATGLHDRIRQQVPGPADVPGDLAQLGRRGGRRELPGDRPARRPCRPPRARVCSGGSSTLTTTPSMSKSSSSRRFSHQAQRRDRGVDAAVQVDVLVHREARAPAASRASSDWVASARPSAPPMPYAHIDSGRSAVIAESIWRSDPAAALRGLAKVDRRPRRARSFTVEAGNRQVHLSANLDHAGAAPLASRWGMASIVRRFWVTSSPTVPSPRVAPRTKHPWW